MSAMSHGRVVGIATAYGLTAEESEFESWQDQEFSLVHIV
jgi:hypothetical protein